MLRASTGSGFLNKEKGSKVEPLGQGFSVPTPLKLGPDNSLSQLLSWAIEDVNSTPSLYPYMPVTTQSSQTKMAPDIAKGPEVSTAAGS